MVMAGQTHNSAQPTARQQLLQQLGDTVRDIVLCNSAINPITNPNPMSSH
jgi:hypothetical protein